MNIPKDKLIRCAEGLGLECASDGFYMEDRFISWESRFVPILLTYAPGGIMDKMGWMAEHFLNQDEEDFFIYNIGTCGDVVKHINNFNDIPAAAIDAYLETLGNGEENKYQKLEIDINDMKIMIDHMNAELQRLREGK